MKPAPSTGTGPYDLPPIHSGHNALSARPGPPASAEVAAVVGEQVALAERTFESCSIEGRLDNRVDVDNEEQGLPIAVCRDPVGGWGSVWPRFGHLD